MNIFDTLAEQLNWAETECTGDWRALRFVARTRARKLGFYDAVALGWFE